MASAQVIDNATPDDNERVEPVNKPSDSKMKQQKLKAWQPILTSGTVLPVFYFIGFVFIPIGSILLVASNNVFEYVHDYTDCEKDGGAKLLCKNESTTCLCRHTFSLSERIVGPLYVYYGLTNFYQNHRRYVKSRDDRQLLGDVSASVSQDCYPFDKSDDKPIVPCGAIANSMFNDTFYLRQLNTDNSKYNKTIPFTFTGIAWESDVKSKFGNPPGFPENILDLKRRTARPKNWNISIFDLAGGLQNESFIVWMRISALPTFRKLYAILDQGLEAGNYTIEIVYNFPVDVFDGRKKFILSTTSWAGGKNNFLGLAYIIVGCLCVFAGTIFFFIHLKYGKTLAEMANVHR